MCGLLCVGVLVLVMAMGTLFPAQQVIYQSNRDNHSYLYILDMERGVELPFRTDGRIYVGSEWSPDGQWLVTAVRDEFGQLSLWLLDANGRHLRPIENLPANSYLPRWSPDAEQIAFVSDADGDYEIYSISLATGEVQQLTHNDATDEHPTYSPDGQQIAFISRQGAEGFQDMYLMDADGSNQRALTSDRAQDAIPSWSADGQTLLWFSERAPGNPCIYERPQRRQSCFGHGDIFTMHLASGEVRRLTQRTGFYWAPRYLPDGETVLLASAFQRGAHSVRSIYTLSAAGRLTRLTGEQGHENFPSWRPRT